MKMAPNGSEKGFGGLSEAFRRRFEGPPGGREVVAGGHEAGLLGLGAAAGAGRAGSPQGAGAAPRLGHGALPPMAPGGAQGARRGAC